MGATARPECPRCRVIRAVLLSLLIGGGAGFAVIAYGGSANLSMLATFFGALAPWLWYARKNRLRREDSA